jgi:predicted alpha-1,2-mannosidase
MNAEANLSEPAASVDPFLGTAISDLPTPEGIASRWWCAKPPVGNCHPGATLPFGMVSVCPSSGCYPSGYGSYAVSLEGAPERLFDENTCTGFAHFQQSGTGRIRMYYNYLSVMPLLDGLADAGRRDVLDDERAEPGWYACRLRNSGVEAELTVGERSATHRYRFPNDAPAPVLALDITMGGLGIDGMQTFPVAAFAEVEGEGRVRGWFRMEGITVHFAAICECEEHPLPAKVWRDGAILEEESKVDLPRMLGRATVAAQGLVFEVPPGGDVKLTVGFSLRSGERARRALGGLSQRHGDFKIARQSAAEMWNDVLDRIVIEGASTEQRGVFYSALYHSFLKPADFSNENPFTRRDGPFFFDISTLWDLYKTQLPLMMTLFPERGRDLVNFLLDTAAREGNFPISYLMDNVSERFDRQGSALAHMTLLDAFWRGIEGIDWDRALRAMFRTLKLGRGKEFKKKGVTHPISHTLDLAQANCCTAALAKGVGDQRVYDACVKLTGHWANAYDRDTGLLIDSDFYEGDRWNYSFRLLHDMAGRIELAGGDAAFVEKLDQFFGFSDPPGGETVFRFEGLNNEPDMETPYAYVFAGCHDRTAEVVRAVLRYQFTSGRGGLPGNDDSGGLSSWYVWSALGIFPVTGQDLLLIGSPLFPRSTMRLPGGEFVIEAENVGPENIYVTEASLNGKSLDRAWLRIAEMQAGGHLQLKMGSQPNSWGQDRRPPSAMP